MDFHIHTIATVFFFNVKAILLERKMDDITC